MCRTIIGRVQDHLDGNKMPALRITATDTGTGTRLHARQWYYSYDSDDGHDHGPSSGLTPAAIGFMVSMVLLLVFAPLYVFTHNCVEQKS